MLALHWTMLHTETIGERYAAKIEDQKKTTIGLFFFIIIFQTFHLLLCLYLQELLFNNKSPSLRAAGKKKWKYATLVHFFWNHIQKRADKTAWPLNSPIGTKKKTMIVAASFGRDNLYTVNVYASIAAIPQTKSFSFTTQQIQWKSLSCGNCEKLLSLYLSVFFLFFVFFPAVPTLICCNFALSSRCARPIILVELCMQKATPTESFVSWLDNK